MSQKFSVLLVAVLATALGFALALLTARPATVEVASAAPEAAMSASELVANRAEFTTADGAICVVLPNGSLDCHCPCTTCGEVTVTRIVTVSVPIAVTEVVTVPVVVETLEPEEPVIETPDEDPEDPSDPEDPEDPSDPEDPKDPEDDPEQDDEQDDNEDDEDSDDEQDDKGPKDKGPKGNNGVGNGEDPQPKGNPKPNDTNGATPGNPNNKGKKKEK